MKITKVKRSFINASVLLAPILVLGATVSCGTSNRTVTTTGQVGPNHNTHTTAPHYAFGAGPLTRANVENEADETSDQSFWS